jgi:exonuclease VII large subunit
MSDIPSVPARPVLPGESERMVSLREFEQRMFALSQQINDQIRSQRELSDTRAEALQTALNLQAEEYRRRLDELNHAHETAMENWRTSLPREMFDSYSNEWQKWRDTVNAQLVTLTHVSPSLTAVELRLQKAEDALQQANGALVLIRFMGFAGVIALVVTFLRMIKLVP